MNTSLLNGIRKEAVTLNEIRKAFSANAHKLLRSGGKLKKKQDLASVLNNIFLIHAAPATNKVIMPKSSLYKVYRYFKPQSPGLKRIANSPKAREVLNRQALLHEVSELSRHPGKLSFEGHQSLKPMLQDLNIAATLRGPGSAARHAIREFRSGEMKLLRDLVPRTRSMNLGYQRISRHTIKNLQKAYEKALVKREGKPMKELLEEYGRAI